MPLLERRLQLLLDHERYDRVRREADRSGRSVNAVIREAIDVRFADASSRRSVAAGAFLDLAEASGEEATLDPRALKDAFDRDLAAALDRTIAQ